jgi:quercetin dioxygenase-like cupin family protein
MNSKINRRQITEFAVADGVLSASQSARAFALSIFGPQNEMDKTSRSNKMPETRTQFPPVPPDDLNRNLTSANPDREGKLLHIGLVGDTYTITVDGDDTKGRFCVVDMHIPPGGGPGPHRHDFEETFIVLDGEIEATFRGKKSVVHAGETVNIPANAPHQFHNTSTNPARMICICSPAGQEKFFLEIGIPVATRTTAPPKLDEWSIFLLTKHLTCSVT